jgi:hypothetical protein
VSGNTEVRQVVLPIVASTRTDPNPAFVGADSAISSEIVAGTVTNTQDAPSTSESQSPVVKEKREFTGDSPRSTGLWTFDRGLSTGLRTITTMTGAPVTVSWPEGRARGGNPGTLDRSWIAGEHAVGVR